MGTVKESKESANSDTATTTVALPGHIPQTPMMQQFWEIKSQHLDKVLLYRMGDFYEMFFEDATVAAPILGIALTSRGKSQGLDVPMCGVPHHSIGPQINKLLSAGLKVAIADQMELPAAGKKIVRRAITRIVTPGIVYDPETLDSSLSHFVAAVIKHSVNDFSLAALDVSTGEILKSDHLSRAELSSWIEKMKPSEFLMPTDDTLPFLTDSIKTLRPCGTVSCADYLMAYASEMQGQELTLTLRPPQELERDILKLSPTTLRHLEIFKRMDGEVENTLFWAVDQTKTPMGARLLRKRLASPFISESDIESSLSDVEFFIGKTYLRENIRSKLFAIGDLERRVARLSNPLCNSRDLQSLACALKVLVEIFSNEELPHKISTVLADTVSQDILKTLLDELPHSLKEGGLIRPGINAALDEFVDLSTHAQQKLSELESLEKEKTGISSLKIKYNSVFGYSFEVTKSNLDKVPAHFVRRQTLAQGERFITAELSELESKILSSQAKRCELEFQMFSDLRSRTLKKALPLLSLAQEVAFLDLATSLAQLACEQNYCRPQFTKTQNLKLTGSRHPVLEKTVNKFSADGVFIPNDLELKNGQCLLLTGPNMAGKSTLMRQVALISILAQSGSFVPATSAMLPLFDQIFTRIGASDNLSQGLSTFMVEMTETAEIITSATQNSLVILDEIGRGTSTYDGMSLAQAILEHFIQTVRPYMLFATHYHELTELENKHSEIINGHMAIKEFKGQLIFLRKLKNGPAGRSYGIDVAKQAGLPSTLTARAQEILSGLAQHSLNVSSRQLDLFSGPSEFVSLEEVERDYGIAGTASDDRGDQLAAIESLKAEQEKLKSLMIEILKVNVDSLTPLQALNHLSTFQNSLKQQETDLT